MLVKLAFIAKIEAKEMLLSRSGVGIHPFEQKNADICTKG